MGKVVHVYPETHAAVKAYCDKIQMGIKDWVDYILQDAVKDPPPLSAVRNHRSGVFAKAQPEPVKRKTEIQQFEGSEGGEQQQPWEKPPFWAGQAKDEGTTSGRRGGDTEGSTLPPDSRL